MQVIVIGAGIGGLTAALALRRTGVDVRVYEQASELREVGAGIQLSPNATRILHRLGLADGLGRVGVRPAAIEHRRWQDGRVLLRQLLGEMCEQTFGAPYYHLYRPDLLGVLAAELPSGVVRPWSSLRVRRPRRRRGRGHVRGRQRRTRGSGDRSRRDPFDYPRCDVRPGVSLVLGQHRLPWACARRAPRSPRAAPGLRTPGSDPAGTSFTTTSPAAAS